MAYYTHNILVEINTGSGWTSIPAANLISVEGAMQLSVNRSNIALVDDSDHTFTVTVRGPQFSVAPGKLPIRATPTRNGSSSQVFWGQVAHVRRSYSTQQWVLSCRGLRSIIQTTKPHTLVVEARPAATKTTLSSIEDPTNPACRSGILNQLAWAAGGRPLEQLAGYPDADWYYSFGQCPFVIRYAWQAGDDTWAAMLNICQAVGGQLFQDIAGVLRFRSVLAFADATPVATLSDGPGGWQDLEEETENDDLVAGKVTVIYVPRIKRILQEVASDDQPRLVEPGTSVVVELQPTYPVVNTQAPTFTATFLNGAAVPLAPSGLTYTASVSAQRILLTISNGAAIPFTVHRIQLQAQPITASTQASASYGSGAERTLDNNDNVQDATLASQRARLTQLISSTPRPLRTARSCVWNPQITLGSVVGITAPAWGLSAVPHLVVDMQISEQTRLTDYTAIDLSGLPRLSQMFIASASAQTTTKKLGI